MAHNPLYFNNKLSIAASIAPCSSWKHTKEQQVSTGAALYGQMHKFVENHQLWGVYTKQWNDVVNDKLCSGQSYGHDLGATAICMLKDKLCGQGIPIKSIFHYL